MRRSGLSRQQDSHRLPHVLGEDLGLLQRSKVPPILCILVPPQVAGPASIALFRRKELVGKVRQSEVRQMVPWRDEEGAEVRIESIRQEGGADRAREPIDRECREQSFAIEAAETGKVSLRFMCKQERCANVAFGCLTALSMPGIICHG